MQSIWTNLHSQVGCSCRRFGAASRVLACQTGMNSLVQLHLCRTNTGRSNGLAFRGFQKPVCKEQLPKHRGSWKLELQQIGWVLLTEKVEVEGRQQRSARVEHHTRLNSTSKR